MNRKVVIAGGSGLIGSRLTDLLLSKGYEVVWLSRTNGKNQDVEIREWDVRGQRLDPDVLEDSYAIINLAGAGIADARWTEKRKQLIIKSRADGTRLLGKTIASLKVPPRVFIGASAIGFYGDRGMEIMTETSPPGSDGFLSNSIQEVEGAIHASIPEGIRTVIPRLGIVQSTKGGALPKLTFPLKFGMATYMGNGKSYVSWVHIDDVCAFLVKSIEDDQYSGVYNITAPNPVTSYEFAQALRKHWSAWSIPFPVPAFMLRILFGEMSHAVLDSTRVLPERLSEAGFDFQFNEIGSALADLKTSRV